MRTGYRSWAHTLLDGVCERRINVPSETILKALRETGDAPSAQNDLELWRRDRSDSTMKFGSLSTEQQEE